MSGPVAFARQVQKLEHLIDSAPSWDALEAGMFGRDAAPDAYKPEDRVKRFVAVMWRTAEGREFLDWIADLTVRGRPAHSGATIEAAAIAHAKHEARYAVGEAIFRAVAEGEELLNRKEPAA
jgi:hypothetical protein